MLTYSASQVPLVVALEDAEQNVRAEHWGQVQSGTSRSVRGARDCCRNFCPSGRLFACLLMNPFVLAQPRILMEQDADIRINEKTNQ